MKPKVATTGEVRPTTTPPTAGQKPVQPTTVPGRVEPKHEMKPDVVPKTPDVKRPVVENKGVTKPI